MAEGEAAGLDAALLGLAEWDGEGEGDIDGEGEVVDGSGEPGTEA